jgi:2'-5' RNA ligase
MFCFSVVLGDEHQSKWDMNVSCGGGFFQMIFALVHYPEINTERIDLLRTKYDPQAHLIAPHVTLIFPLPETVAEPALISHIEGVLLRWKPFPIRLAKLEKSLDDLLFLTPTEGAENLPAYMTTCTQAYWRRIRKLTCLIVRM